jgi:GSH-dependent disulfide-bond oxidoreductase
LFGPNVPPRAIPRRSEKMAAPAEEKPGLPEGYKVPEVYEFQDLGGKMGAMNRPTAGKRSDEDLPVGTHPIQLYSLGTPNGHKVTIMLEELNEALGLEYDAWNISIFELKQFTSGFVDINPNSKIPAMVDRSLDPPMRVFESGNILLYLADKHKMFIPQDIRGRTECLSWLFWQMGSAPTIGGGFGHFYNYAPVKIQYCIERFAMETKRLMDVLDKRLAEVEYVAGSEYTIADMAIMPWVRCISWGYKADKFLSMHEYTNIARWMETILKREPVKRGLRVNGFSDDAVKERHSAADFK